MTIKRKLPGFVNFYEQLARGTNEAIEKAESATTKSSGSIGVQHSDGSYSIFGAIAGTDDTNTGRSSVHIGDTIAPGFPTGISVSSVSGVLVVDWDGTLNGGVPDDFHHMTVYMAYGGNTYTLGEAVCAMGLTSGSISSGTSVEVWATAEDDNCNEDGSPNHNVSGDSEHFTVVITDTAAEVEKAVDDANAEIATVKGDISAFKSDVSTNYSTKKERKDGDDALLNKLTTEYTNTADADAKYAVESEVKQTTDEISATVSSNYTDLNTKASAAKSAADAAQSTANTAKTNAATAQSTADAAKTSADKANSDISSVKTDYATKAEVKTTTDEISASVEDSLTEAKTYSDGKVATEVTDRNAAITAKATEINSTVASTYTTKSDFDALQVGGTNLIRGTKTLDGSDLASLQGTRHTDTLFNGCDTVETKRAWHGYKFRFNNVASRVGLKVGDVVTYSVWAMFSSAPTKASIFAFYTSPTTAAIGNVASISTSDTAGKWFRVEKTFTVTEELLSVTVMRIESGYFETSDYQTSTCNVWFACPKLERGNKATDWTPAPEDMLSTADAATTYATQSSLTQQADRITAEVTARKATDSNVTELSTKVTQNSDSIVTVIGEVQTAQSTANSASTAASTADGKAVAAQSTATDTQNRVATQETLIRESSDGVDVGKAVSGAYPEGTPVARAGSDGAFHIMKKLLGVLTSVASFGENLIELGKNSTSAVIKFCAGTGEIGVIDSMLTLFADKVGVKGNSQAVLASNGESNVAAGKQNTTYAGLSQIASTAPSTDADPATALLQARCTKNSDSSTVSESYINLTAKPDGTAPATVKASEIAMNSSAQTNKHIRVKTDSSIEVDCPHVESQNVHIGSYNTSTGQPVDSGIAYIPIYGDAQTPACYLNVQQLQTPMYLIPMTRVETTLQPAVLYASTATGTAAGGTGTINLTETIEHFETVEVTFGRDGKFQTQKLDLNNGRRTLSLFLAYSPSTIHRTGIVNLTFSGTTATLSDGFFSDNGGVWTALDTIFSIYRITGRK